MQAPAPPAGSHTGHSTRTTDFLETLSAPHRPAAQRYGKYEVIGELGEGGMGRVYKAVDSELGRIVAVKVLRSSDPFEANRFRGEAEMIAALDHPNIIKVFDIATPPDERPYIVLEYLEGGSLDKELGGQPQEPRRAAEMVETLARAVHFAHQKEIIHRDLKPANVLRAKDKDKTLKLTDFGLAKELEVSSGMTPSGAVMGTPSYMSPEQAEGKVKLLGPTADVYGLGAILYEMLTGRPPFRGVNMVDTLEQVRWAEPAPPSRLVPRLHRDLATVCLKCLQKAPARRYQTAEELADDLRHWLNGETIKARPAPSWERLVRQVKRRPWEAATVAAIVLLIGLLVFGWVIFERKSAQEKVRDEQAAAQEQIRAEQEKLQKEREVAREASEDRLRQQARAALAALNRIRELILEGELSRKPGLDPLYGALGTFYDDLIAQKNSGFDKVELADGLVKVGDLFRRTGQKARARDAYGRARDECRALAETDPKAREVLASALLRGGQVAFELSDDSAVEAACDAADALLAPLGPAPGGSIANPLAAGQIAEAYHLRGQLLGRKGQLARAEAAYRQSLAVRERLTESVPPDLSKLARDEQKRVRAALTDLGRGFGYLGDVLLDANKVAEAEAAYWRSHEIRQQVVATFPPTDKPSGEELDARHQLARSWGNFATLHARSRALGTARYFAQQSLDAHTALAELDAINVEYKLDVCNRRVQVAELDILLRARPGAKLDDQTRKDIVRNLDEAKKVPEDQSSEKEKRSRRARGTLATAVVLRSALLVDTGDPQAVRKELFDAYTLLDDLCKDQAGVTVDPVHRYYRAAAVTLMTELSGSVKDPQQRQRRLAELRVAVEKLGPGRIHPDDVEPFRAFRALADDSEFKKLMNELRARTGPKPAALAQ